MPKGCCGHASCSCQVITEGRMHVEGSGQPGDPFILSEEGDFDSAHNSQFDTTASGSGTMDDPWVIETTYASTAKLDGLPDVNAPTPTNGQVLAWNTATAKWIPQAPTTAPTGAVSHDTSLSGDGSAGSPLAVAGSVSRLIGTYPTGVGLNDAGLASVVQHFTNAAARTAALPAPALNTLSMLDTAPGIIYYWTGTVWATLPNQTAWSATTAFLALSGPYSAGLPITVMVVQLSTTTDGLGVFDVLTALDLTGRSGVLALTVQETGTVGWKAVVRPNVTKVSGTAFRLTDGTVMAGTPITAVVTAYLY